MLSDLPFDAPQELVAVNFDSVYLDRLAGFPLSFFEEFAAEATTATFANMAAVATTSAMPDDLGPPRSIGTLEMVIGNYFEVFRFSPVIGRQFESARLENGTTPAVISYGYWQSEWGGNPNALGQTVQISGRQMTIVGVMPAGSRSYFTGNGLASTAVWIPVDMADPSFRRPQYRVIGRLLEGETVRSAQAHLDTIAPRLEGTEAKGRFPVRSLISETVGDFTGAILIFAGAVGMVWLIGVLNLVSLQSSRISKRERELAVRAALGASRIDMLRSTTVEALILTGSGALLGLALAYTLQDVVRSRIPRTLPRWDEIVVDANAFVFAVVVALVAGVILGVFPAFRASRPDLNGVLKEGTSSLAGGVRQRVIRSTLIFVQTSLATVLLVGSALLIYSFGRLTWVDFGFDTESVSTIEVTLPRSYGDEDAAAFAARLLGEARTLPGVDNVAISDTLPGFRSPRARIEAADTGVDAGTLNQVHFQSISEGYGNVLDIPLIYGRWINSVDVQAKRAVVVVSESLASQFWPGENATGKRLRWPDGVSGAALPWMEVVGVVGNVRDLFDHEIVPKVYAPYRSDGAPNAFPDGLYIAVRSSIPAVESTLEDMVLRIEPDSGTRVAPMDSVVSRIFERQRFQTVLISAFAGVAVVLSMLGVYSVVSFSTAQRTREIGIRMAIGARRRDVVWQMMRQGSIPAVVGLVVGLGAAFALSEVLRSYLHEIEPTDLRVYAAVFLLAGGSVFIASWLPARRAASVDPMSALHEE